MKWFLAIVGILVLLGMIAGAGVGLWWWLAPEPPVATRSFLVQSHREVIFRDPRSPSQIEADRDIERYRATIVAAATSTSVVQTALLDPRLQGIDALRRAGNPSEWIEDRIVAEFEADSEYLKISLKVGQLQDEDAVAIVDAIGDAFYDEVVTQERLDRIRTRDALRATFNILREDLHNRYEEYYRLEEDLGDAADKSADLKMRDLDLKRMVRHFDEISTAVEAWDIELRARPRIQSLGKACIEEEE